MALVIKIPPRTMSHIIKKDLGISVHQSSTGVRLVGLRQIRVTRLKKLPQLHANNFFYKLLI